MKVSLRAANGQYVCAEGGGGGEVVANRAAVGAWELFEMAELGGGRASLRANNGQYVCAEGGGGQKLVANRNAVGPWETFTLGDMGGGKISLRANNGQYVCAEGGGGREVVANRAAVGPWETFEMSTEAVYDVAISMDEGALNRVVASLYARPGLRARLFAGTQKGTFSGVEMTVGWDVLQPPKLSLVAPTPEQWKKSVKADGSTTPQPTANAFVVNFPQLKVSRQSPGEGAQETTVPLEAICSVGLRNNELVIDPVAAVVDLSQAAPLDKLVFKMVVIPQALKMADQMLSGKQIPDIDFKGLKFGPAVLLVGNHRMVGVANLEGKPQPPAPALDGFPPGAFYLLLSPEALRRVTEAGTKDLQGKTANTSGSESFGIGKAQYNAGVRINSVSANISSADLTVANANVGITATASAGVDLLGGIIGGVTDAANTVAKGATDAANTVAKGVTDTANKVADAFSGY